MEKGRNKRFKKVFSFNTKRVCKIPWSNKSLDYDA